MIIKVKYKHLVKYWHLNSRCYFRLKTDDITDCDVTSLRRSADLQRESV